MNKNEKTRSTAATVKRVEAAAFGGAAASFCEHFTTQNRARQVSDFLLTGADVGLSMMCYTVGKEKRTALGDFQLRGRMGKLLYCLCRTASCLAKSSKE